MSTDSSAGKGVYSATSDGEWEGAGKEGGNKVRAGAAGTAPALGVRVKV